MSENKVPLKVLMMGGRRCGKTSVLASLFEQMINGDAKRYFTIADRTALETKGFERQDSLGDKTLELKNMLESNQGKSNIFLVDQRPTNNFWLYKLHLQIPGTHREMDIEFRDSAGEFFEASGIHAQETQEYIKDCDVFVIVIDTPYLMGPTDETTKGLCNEAVNGGTNRVQDLQNFLTYINDNEGKDAKMVVFVPLKCEKWIKERKIGEVVKRVKEVYNVSIKNLMAYSKMNISIIPMETCGNILFSEFRKAYLYNSMEGTVRCCKIAEDIIRKEDGENEPLMEGETVNPDPAAVIAGTNIVRPYSWYSINPADGSYAPRNCEQLPLHILRFMLAKLYDADTRKSGKWYDFFVIIINKVKSLFGTIDVNELQSIIQRMQQDGIIKDSGYGIEILKKF